MTVTLQTLATVSVLLFVISSMASMGLSLSMAQIVTPLANLRRVALVLLCNFVLAPALAIVITIVLPVNESIRLGLILLSTAAGAPFLPKLVQVAKGSTAFAVGLMVLLMVVTIFYLPVVLPLVVKDIEIQPWRIGRSLLVLMLLPLAVGMLVRSRYEEAAEGLQRVFAQASNIALMLLIVLGIVLNFQAMLGLVGSYGILAAIILIVGLLFIGTLLGGRDPAVSRVMGLGAAQRNISAALVVAGQNFGMDVITYILVFAMIGLVILMPVSGELGRRAAKA